MVRLALLVLIGVSGPAHAQVVDWRRAGGDLFGAPSRDTRDATSGPEAQRLPELDPPFRLALNAAAERHNLDVKLLQALVLTESGFRPDAVSPAGAAGLTQLMPATARELGVRDRFDPAENLLGGADYLARQLVKFGDVRLALAAYNAGPARVQRLGRVPRIAETQQYVATVIECYLALTAGRDVRSPGACRVEAAP
ncbi:lytic transglycosylase domain-containing protein [Brevundimonas sp.]|jgi:soluble lytic murein transglycosylase-like protein|uniref:lytic transglycosylase domain-containing protein n=1 Tax=Brevundimonas sp. TaxID=1871086 RepID=UPI0037BFF031